MSKKKIVVPGAKFAAPQMAKPRPRAFFRATSMSLGMAKAGVIPDVHLVSELCAYGFFRAKSDTNNIRRSAFVPLMVS